MKTDRNSFHLLVHSLKARYSQDQASPELEMQSRPRMNHPYHLSGISSTLELGDQESDPGHSAAGNNGLPFPNPPSLVSGEWNRGLTLGICVVASWEEG